MPYAPAVVTDAVVEIPPLLVAARAASVRVAVRSPSRLLGGPEIVRGDAPPRARDDTPPAPPRARRQNSASCHSRYSLVFVFERALERVPLGSRATTREVLGVRARAVQLFHLENRLANILGINSPFAARFSARTLAQAKRLAHRERLAFRHRRMRNIRRFRRRVRRRVRRATLLLFCRRRLRGRPRRVRSGVSRGVFRRRTGSFIAGRVRRVRLPRNVRRLIHLLRVLRRFVQFSASARRFGRSRVGCRHPGVFSSRAFDVSDGVPVLVRGEENFSVGVRSTEPLARHDATGDGESDRAAKLGEGHESVPVEVRGS